MTKNQIYLLKSMMLGYAIFCIENSKDYADKLWYKYAQDIVKYFSKKKPEKFNKRDVAYLNKKQKELIALDEEYFKDKMFSSYICCHKILEYLVLEVRDIELRNRFLYLDYKRIREELHLLNDEMEGVDTDTDKYLAHLLKNIG